MRTSIAVALSLTLAAACAPGGGPLVAPCSGPNCTSTNGGPLDAGDGGSDAGDGGADAGDGGADAGDAGPCQSFTGTARDFCRTGQSQAFYLGAAGCNATLFFDLAAVCSGVIGRGDSFDGGCSEPAGQLNCTAPALPGTITCQTGPGTNCRIVACGPGQSFGADGGCTP